MKNNLGPSRRGKGAAVGLVICFVAVIALVGFFTFSRYKRDMSRQLAKAEEKLILKKTKDIKETEKSQTTNSQAIQNKAQETENKRRDTNTDRAETESDLTNGNTARCAGIFRK